jgi:hypothetical protein
MDGRIFFSSLTRIADLERIPFETTPVSREKWRAGQYVLGEVVGPPGPLTMVELASGLSIELVEGDRVVGAFGVRQATLEVVGDYHAIGDDLRIQALTGAGLFGRATSTCSFLPPLLTLDYLGHATRSGRTLSMGDFVTAVEPRPYDRPTILLIGTSMAAGKTTCARIIIRELKRRGLRVAGVKLTGAGRYRDILGMREAGADHVFDFVDAGLPSTACDPDLFRGRIAQLLSRIAASGPDVVVAEAGASPLEPYNGHVMLEKLGSSIRCTVLCASDPYAVFGVTHAFGIRPDLVAGVATSTSAGIQLVARLTGLPALNLLDSRSRPRLNEILASSLDL